jgi:hypothetical protein
MHGNEAKERSRKLKRGRTENEEKTGKKMQRRSRQEEQKKDAQRRSLGRWEGKKKRREKKGKKGKRGRKRPRSPWGQKSEINRERRAFDLLTLSIGPPSQSPNTQGPFQAQSELGSATVHRPNSIWAPDISKDRLLFTPATSKDGFD